MTLTILCYFRRINFVQLSLFAVVTFHVRSLAVVHFFNMFWNQLFVILFLIILMVSIRFSSAVSEERCSNPKFVNCSLVTTTMTLWCDHTNFTFILNEEELHSNNARYYAPPHKASVVLFNFSCIKELSKDKIEIYQHMKVLNLEDNFIETLTTNSFGKPQRLEEVYLSRNKIYRIDIRAFNDLKNLLHLHLDHNQLTRVPARTFNSLSKLKVLKLDHNQLENVPRTLFRGLISLEELDLSGNHLQVFLPLHLKGLTKLKSLNLEGNQLKTFEIEGILLASANLIGLNLNNNQISCLDDHLNGHKLSTLKIANNPLEIPKKKWISNQLNDGNSGVEISFNGSWVCDCKAYSYMKYLQSLKNEDKETLLFQFDIVCFDPPALRGKKLRDLDWEELKLFSNCSDPDSPTSCQGSETSDKKTTTTTIASTITSNTLSHPTTTLKAEFISPVHDEDIEPSIAQTNKHILPEARNIEPTVMNQNTYKILIIGIVVALFVGLAIIVIIVLIRTKQRKTKQVYDESSEKVNEGDGLLQIFTQRVRNDTEITDLESVTIIKGETPQIVSRVILEERGRGVGRSPQLNRHLSSRDLDETIVKTFLHPRQEQEQFDRISNHTYQSVNTPTSSNDCHSWTPEHQPSSTGPSQNLYSSVVPGYFNYGSK